MVEVVDWHNLNERHRFVTVETWSSSSTNSLPPDICVVCGKSQDDHWFPKQNPRVVLEQASNVVDEYLKKLLE